MKTVDKAFRERYTYLFHPLLQADEIVAITTKPVRDRATFVPTSCNPATVPVCPDDYHACVKNSDSIRVSSVNNFYTFIPVSDPS